MNILYSIIIDLIFHLKWRHYLKTFEIFCLLLFSSNVCIEIWKHNLWNSLTHNHLLPKRCQIRFQHLVFSVWWTQKRLAILQFHICRLRKVNLCQHRIRLCHRHKDIIELLSLLNLRHQSRPLFHCIRQNCH